MEDMHKYWSHKWVNPKIVIKKSLVHGQGSFASKLIKKDEVVSVNGGLVVPISESKDLLEKMGSLRGLQISDDFLLTVATPEEAMFNHGCEPNLGLKGPIMIIAMRDIHPGEEVFFSYFFSDIHFSPFTCGCNSEECRIEIKPTGWGDDLVFQKKYSQYFSPYLQEKF